MKAYLITTASLFGLLAVVHVWRMIAEGAHVAADPFFLGITVVTAAMCAWALQLLRRQRPS